MDLQVTFFGFFCWIILGMVVKTAFFMPRRTYAIEKKILTKLFFNQFLTMRDIFLNFHWNIWCMVVKTTVYVFRGALWEGFRTMKKTLQSFIEIYYALLSKLQFTCSEEHHEEGYLFLRFFQRCFRTLSDNRLDLWRKFSAALPKLHSTSPNNFSIFLQIFVMFFSTSYSSEKNLSS